jgi:hypothetical protein
MLSTFTHKSAVTPPLLVQATVSILAPNRSRQNGVSKIDPSIDSNTYYQHNSKSVPTLCKSGRYVLFRKKLAVNGNKVCYYHNHCTLGQGSQCAMQDTTETIYHHEVTTEAQAEVIGCDGHGV